MQKLHHEMTDEALAQTAACGGRAAFDEIVHRYCRPLTRFAASKTGAIQDAEDIVQETFLRAYQNRNSYDSQYSLKNWLFTIAYRLIVSGYRKKRPQQLSDEAAVQLATNEPGPQENQWVWEVARELGTDAFTALWLRYKQDMTTNEIAQVMKKSKIMVRVLLHRSRIRLAKQIVDQADLPEQSQWKRGRAVLVERTK